MAKITRSLSTKTDNTGKSEILLRVTVSRDNRIRLKSGIFISPSRFRDGQIIKPRSNQREVAELVGIEGKLTALEAFLLKLCTANAPRAITKEFLREQVERKRHPERFPDAEPKEQPTFFDAFDEYIEAKKRDNVSEWRLKHYKVLMRTLHRYELYRRLASDPDYSISIDDFGLDDVLDFKEFLKGEAAIYAKYPQIYISFPADTHAARKSRMPSARGNNTVVNTIKRLRAFFNWCVKAKKTAKNPFEKYSDVCNDKEEYGTPYFITIDERNAIQKFDLSATPELEVQRDIFVFHCFVGCRVSDLIKLTPSNYIGGEIQYYASKTKKKNPKLLKVPLHERAAVLVEKYRGKTSDGRLFPFITPQRYNDAIKKIFKACGITRMVIVKDPITGEAVSKPLDEIASSHIARRTFVGNLYKKIQDPNIIGEMSGHVPGSRAFARYREIDREIKEDAISLMG